tara:strand:- start:188 stop:583 length:396 start_codon:yes stop_codon:yes gene_type:complete
MTDFFVFGKAIRMIAYYLKDTTIGHAVPTAFRDHAFEFRLQRLKPLETLLHLFQLPLRDGIGVGTGLLRVVGKRQKFANGINGKTQLTSMTNERQPVQIDRMITPLPALCALWSFVSVLLKAILAQVSTPT